MTIKAADFDRIIDKLGFQTRASGDLLAWFVHEGRLIVRTKRSRKSGLVLALVLSFWLHQAVAEPAYPNWTFLKDSSGGVWMIFNGVRVGVPIQPASDEDIAAIPFSGRWLVGKEDGSGVTTGDRPDVLNAQAQPAVPAAAHPPAWQRVGQWTGRSDKVTEPFEVKAQQWRIAFTMRDSKYSNPQVCIRAQGVGGGKIVSSGCYRQDDTTYVYAGGGIYFLSITSLDEWSVTVEELQ